MASAPPPRPSSLRRNALANLTGRVASAALWVAVTPFALERLGSERFGVWSLFFALSGYLATLDLGMASGMARFVAVASATGRRASVIAVLRRTLPVGAASGLVACAAAVLLRGVFVRAFHVPALLASEVEQSLALFGLSMFAFSLAQVLLGALMGFQRLDLQNACFLAGLVLHAVLLVAGLALGGGLLAAVAAMLAGHLLAGTLAASSVRGCLRKLDAGEPAEALAWRELLGYGLMVQATNACAVGQLQAGKVLLGLLGRLVWVTQFELGFRVANALWSLPALVLGAVIPAAAQASTAGGAEAMREVYRWACRWVFAVAGVVLAGLWLTAAPLLTLWLGPGHHEAVAVARALAIGFAVATLSAPAGSVARGGGWPALETRAMGSALALNLLASLWLVPRFGPVGAAWAMGLSYGLAGVGLLVVLHRRLGVPLGGWLARTAAPRFLLPAAAAAAVALTTTRAVPATRGVALSTLALESSLFALLALALSWTTGDARVVWTRLRARVAGSTGAGPADGFLR